MLEGGLEVFDSHIGVTSFAMGNGFFQVLNPFADLQTFSSHLRKIQRRFRMLHKLVNMPLFTMGHCLLRVIDG